MIAMTSLVTRQDRAAPAVTTPPAQAKLRIGPVDDPLEHEADRIADAVVARRSFGPIACATAHTPQRKCAQCEVEEDKTLRRKATIPASTPSHGASVAAASVAHGGAALTRQQRAYFEPRFGRDLSDVRLHLGDGAGAAATQMHARAFTLGHDIAFARGEFQPETDQGRHLIAHELAHVVQQASSTSPVIRRASYGTGAPPNWGQTTLGTIPVEEQAQVDEAVAMIDELVSKPQSFSECHDHFASYCPGGVSSTLASVWRRATIWRITSSEPNTNAMGSKGSNLGYTKQGLDQGTEGLAGSFLHELGHNCGIPGDDTHWKAAKIRTYCIGAGRNSFSAGVGIDLGGQMPSLVLSYRRFLGDLASGRLKFTLGADINVVGATAGIAENVGSLRGTQRSPAEFGSVIAGGQARIGGWGGSRYGGIALRFETGFGVGQFALRQAANEDPKSAVAPAWILQVGPRAEFLVKSGDAHVFPFSISAALRHVQPINGEARALTAIVGSVEFPF
jgi:Domain of unknown function (DUF4157)